jgi:hypothetical protein
MSEYPPLGPRDGLYEIELPYSVHTLARVIHLAVDVTDNLDKRDVAPDSKGVLLDASQALNLLDTWKSQRPAARGYTAPESPEHGAEWILAEVPAAGPLGQGITFAEWPSYYDGHIVDSVDLWSTADFPYTLEVSKIERDYLQFTGFPLDEPLAIEYEDESAGVYMLDHHAAERLVNAWAEARTYHGIVREWAWLEGPSTFVTALCMDGEINIGHWIESGGLFYTSDMPFDFEFERVTR